MKRRNLPVFILIFCLGFLCFAMVQATAGQITAGQPEERPVASEPPLVPELPERLVLTAVGDIMMHNSQIAAGFVPALAGYDYSSFFHGVKPLLLASDLVVGNLETPLAGKAAGYSGYPRFNAPEVLAQNLKEAGFHVVSTANNHCLDKGQQGVFQTIEHLEAAGLIHTGTSRTPEESERIVIIERKGIRIALLAATESTNGLRTAKDCQYSVNLLDTEKLCQQIKEAHAQGAGLVVAMLHFGQEYQPFPSQKQQAVAAALLEAGADIILGSHPHVLQPAVIWPRPQQEKGRGFVIYSLGNFISDQAGLERKTSILLNIHLDIDPVTKKAVFAKAEYIPLYTHRYRQDGATHFQVLPVEPALNSIERGDPTVFTVSDREALRKAWNHATTMMRSEEADFNLKDLPLPLSGLSCITGW